MKQVKDIITWEEKMQSKAVKIKHRTIRTIKRTWRPRTAIIVVFFILCTLMPVLGGCSTRSNQQQQAPQVDNTPSTAALHEGKISDLKALLAKAGSIPPAELRSGLVIAKQELASLNSKMEGEFADTSEVLTRLNLPEKLKIQEDVVAKFQSSKDRLNAALDETVASSDSDINVRSSSLYGLVNELCPEEESQPLGTELPNQLIERDPVAPVLGANIAPAYMHGAPGLTPSDLPVDPTPEDLAPTIDAQHSQEIIDKAAELENDPVKIYEWVRNNIDFEPYYGSKKGATETLAEMAGNDMDTASLLIALCRVSGIPARYVTGVIDITADQAMAWTATEVPEAALRLFASGGTPITGIQEGGQITRCQLTHTFTEAYLNYSNYRGAMGGESPKEWIPLDGSYKAYGKTEGIRNEIEDAIGFNSEEWENNNWGAQIDEASWSFSGVNGSAIKNRTEEMAGSFTTYLQSISGDSKMLDIIGGRFIIGNNLGIIPAVLEFKTNNLYESSVLDTSDRYLIEINIGGMQFEVETPSLTSQSMSLYFHPASDEDAQIIERYGFVSRTPAYLLSVVPTLLIGEQEVSRGDPLQFSSKEFLRIEVNSPLGTIGASEDFINATGVYTIVFNTGTISKSNYLKGLPGQSLDKPGYILSAEFQAFIGMKYFFLREWFLGSFYNQNLFRRFGDVSWGVFASSYDESTCYDVPLRIKPCNLYTDIDSLNEVGVSTDGNNNYERSARLINGFLSSYLEHQIYNSVFDLEAVSTARIIYENVLDESSISVLFGNLVKDPQSLIPNLSNEETSEMKSQLLNGNLILSPTQPSSLENWQGRGWQAIDVFKGSSGSFIHGGLAGGSTTGIISLDALQENDPPSSSVASLILGSSIEEMKTNDSIVKLGLPFGVVENMANGMISIIDKELKTFGVINDTTKPDLSLGENAVLLGIILSYIFFEMGVTLVEKWIGDAMMGFIVKIASQTNPDAVDTAAAIYLMARYTSSVAVFFVIMSIFFDKVNEYCNN
jgi:hypothetical protein